MAELSWMKELEEYLRPGEPGWRRELRERYGVVQAPRPEPKPDPAEASPEEPRRVLEPEEVEKMLEEAEREVELAKDWARRAGPYPKIHEHVRKAHEHLRAASRAMGFRPEGVVPAEEWRKLPTPDLLSSLEVGVSVLGGRGLTPEEKRRALDIAKDLIDIGSDPTPEVEREEAEYEEARRRALRAPGPKLLPV